VKYTTNLAAWCGLIVGLSIGMARLILEIMFLSRNDNFVILDYFIRFNYLLFGACLFLVTLVVMIIATLLTPKSYRPDMNEVEKYCYDYTGLWNLITCSYLIMKLKRNTEENKLVHDIEDQIPEYNSEMELNDYMYVSPIHNLVKFLIIPLFIGVISIMIFFG
jgi:hypothetical protein